MLSPSKSNPPDLDLARQAQDGNLAAFNALVARYQSLAYNITYRITGSADSAGDATQEAMILAYRKIRQYRGGSFKAWLGRIATNCAYDRLRARQRRRSESIEDIVEDEDRNPALVDGSPSPEERALSGELSEAITAAITRLSPDQQAVLVLVDLNGFNYDEASAALGVSLGTIKSRLSRARAAVRQILLERPELLPDNLRH